MNATATSQLCCSSNYKVAILESIYMRTLSTENRYCKRYFCSHPTKCQLLRWHGFSDHTLFQSNWSWQWNVICSIKQFEHYFKFIWCVWNTFYLWKNINWLLNYSLFSFFSLHLDIVFQYMVYISSNNQLISFRVRKAYDF